MICLAHGRRALLHTDLAHNPNLRRTPDASTRANSARQLRGAAITPSKGFGKLLLAMHGSRKMASATRISSLGRKPRVVAKPRADVLTRQKATDATVIGFDPFTKSSQKDGSAPESAVENFRSASDTFKDKQASSDAAAQGKDLWIARAVIMTCAALYGTNFASVKLLDESLDPSMAALLRFTLAALIFLPQLLAKGFRNSSVISGGREVGLFVWLGYVTQAISLESTPASIVAFICSLSVIVVPLLDAIFQNAEHRVQVQTIPSASADQNLGLQAGDGMKADDIFVHAASTIRGALGDKRFTAFWPALVATAGVACLELGGTTTPGIGDLWAMGQPLFFGLGFWRAEHHMRHLHEDGEAEAFTGSLLATIAFLSIFWAAHDWAYPVIRDAEMQGVDIAAALGTAFSTLTPILQDWHVLAAIAWTGVVTTALTTFGENYAMKSLSSSETTVIFSTEPLWGTAFAAMTLGESVGQNTFMGAILILMACMWSSFDSIAPMLKQAFTTLASILGAEEFLENSGEKTKMVSSKILPEFEAIWDSLSLPDDLPPFL